MNRPWTQVLKSAVTQPAAAWSVACPTLCAAATLIALWLTGIIGPGCALATGGACCPPSAKPAHAAAHGHACPAETPQTPTAACCQGHKAVLPELRAAALPAERPQWAGPAMPVGWGAPSLWMPWSALQPVSVFLSTARLFDEADRYLRLRRLLN